MGTIYGAKVYIVRDHLVYIESPWKRTEEVSILRILGTFIRILSQGLAALAEEVE